MKIIKGILCCIINVTLIFSGCTSKTEDLPTAPSPTVSLETKYIPISPSAAVLPPAITRRPPVAVFPNRDMKTLPAYNPYVPIGLQVDIRSVDLSAFDLTGRANDLLYSSFDSKTRWPQKLPQEFDPSSVLDGNKNPGLNIHSLHSQGITGKGVNMAIIDAALLVDHIEYNERLKMYEEIHCLAEQAQMHASAVASIAVGKTVGVAPEANLYFIGCTNATAVNNTNQLDFTWIAKAVERIIEVNTTLPKEQKIRVLSISACWSPDIKGYDEMTAAANRAAKEGIFVVSANLFETYKEKFYFYGLDIDALADRDHPSSYSIIPWAKWILDVRHIGGFSNYYEKCFDENIPKEILLIPQKSKTTASPTGNSDYVFYRDAGWSWVIPYMAGLYTLSCQIKPNITPEIFWNTALETGDSKIILKGHKNYIGKIVNPEHLIESLKSMK